MDTINYIRLIKTGKNKIKTTTDGNKLCCSKVFLFLTGLMRDVKIEIKLLKKHLNSLKDSQRKL